MSPLSHSWRSGNRTGGVRGYSRVSIPIGDKRPQFSCSVDRFRARHKQSQQRQQPIHYSSASSFELETRGSGNKKKRECTVEQLSHPLCVLPRNRDTVHRLP
uniref:Uncharacterized protein n=1 Tax=Nelumbo nucifera TaxID=4432 RepID=A0A822XNP1_NELNU|nr:TPA_asm: hypothetical protein HUJ06_022132 [Nelumbo nucifera]